MTVGPSYRVLVIITALVFLVFTTHGNDDRDFAIKIANCRRACVLKFHNKTLTRCVEQCTLVRACSLYACPLFCGRNNADICTTTCKSFIDDVTCETPCATDPNVTVTVWEGVPSINVSVHDLPSGTLTHVILLQQINKTTKANLTFDTSFENFTTFTGLYPWMKYSIDVAVMKEDACCLYHDDWVGNTSYDIIAANSKVEFYPYPFPSHWIDGSENGTSVKFVHIFPADPTYYIPSYPSNDLYDSPWFWYDDYENTAEPQFHVQAGNHNLTKYMDCSPVNTLYCIMWYGMGYMVNVNVQPVAVSVHVQSGDTMKELKIRKRTTCRNFPNLWTTTNQTLQIHCATFNEFGNNTTVTYRNEHVFIRYCFTNHIPGGPLDRNCCPEGVGCIHSVTNKTLTLNKTRDYLFYFSYNVRNISCQYSNPCDGFYQRISPSVDGIPECEVPHTPTNIVIIIVPILSVVVILVIGVISIALWRHEVNKRNEMQKKTDYIPSEEDALLGGKLSRDAISKERYIDRGNFGYIFEGKLKVKLKGMDDLTKQYEVALKILKSKVDDNEDPDNCLDNVKEAKKAMKAEINIMQGIQDGRPVHPNVLRMYGYVVDAPPYILVLELCFTNLTRYLRQLRIQIDNKTLSPNDIELGTCLASTTNTPHVTQRPLNTLISHSIEENSVSIVNTIPDRIRMGLSRNASGYNDSVHGRMMKEIPSMERYKDTVLTRGDLLDYCWQVSCGMDFLHSIDLIHRDLAADNVLIKENEDRSLTLKICDFGQSRSLFHGNYVGSGDTIANRQRMIRLRWTAPEIKQDAKKWCKFSDVWSYGVFMWEVHTLGGKPYSDWPDHLVLDKLLEGERMQRPSCCIDPIWKIACRCWDESPEKREHFSTIKIELEEIKSDERDKNLGIEKSDYIKCDMPDEEEMRDGSEVDVNIMDVDENEGPLSWEFVQLEEESTSIENEDNIQLPNGAAYENALAVLQMMKTELLNTEDKHAISTLI